MANGDIIDTMLGWICLITKKDCVAPQGNDHIGEIGPGKVKEAYESILKDIADNSADTSRERIKILKS